MRDLDVCFLDFNVPSTGSPQNEDGREREEGGEREKEGGREGGRERERERAVSYTHLTLPTTAEVYISVVAV